MLIQRTDPRFQSTVKKEVEDYILDRVLLAEKGYVEGVEERILALTGIVSNLIEVLVEHGVLELKTLQEITDDYGVSYEKVET